MQGHAIGDQMGGIAMPQIMDADGGTVSGNHAMLAFDLLSYGQAGCFVSSYPRSPQRDTCSALNNPRLSKNPCHKPTCGE